MSRDELVRGVVLVGGNQQSAVEAGAGLADGAPERVVVVAAPTRRGEARGASTTFIPSHHAQRHIHCDIFTGGSPLNPHAATAEEDTRGNGAMTGRENVMWECGSGVSKPSLLTSRITPFESAT